MWRSMFVSETILRRSIRLLKRIERFGWSKLSQTNVNELDVDRAIFVWPWKVFSVSVHYLFYQPMDEKNQNMDSSFSRQRKP